MELLKKSRGLLAILSILSGGALFVTLTGNLPDSQTGAAAEGTSTLEQALPSAAELKDISLKYDVRISSIERELQSTRESLGNLREALEKLVALQNESLRQDPERHDPLPETPSPPRTPARLLSIPGTPPPPSRSARVPAGSFGEATLLTGVYAPVTGEPMPVLLRLDAVLIGPSRSRIPIAGAFLIGRAQGDANTARATVQVTKLSLVTPDGTARERDVNGYLADADGVQGLAGRYVWNAEEWLALSMGAGAASGAAQALGQAQTSVTSGPAGVTQQVTGDAWKVIGAGAAAHSIQGVIRVIEDRLKEFVPAVYVGNRARRVTVIFLEGVSLDGIENLRPSDGLGAFE